MFMGKVVDIESQPRRRRSRKRPSKTALVLGGGGFTGGVYEIGALRALDLLAVNSTVNNFDVYVDTCERIVFGEESWSDVPISKAVQCSTTLPLVYKPVDLKGRQLIDGGIRSTTNVDIAVEKGAKFIIVVNPLVPFVNDFEKTM